MIKIHFDYNNSISCHDVPHESKVNSQFSAKDERLECTGNYN